MSTSLYILPLLCSYVVFPSRFLLSKPQTHLISALKGACVRVFYDEKMGIPGIFPPQQFSLLYEIKVKRLGVFFIAWLDMFSSFITAAMHTGQGFMNSGPCSYTFIVSRFGPSLWSNSVIFGMCELQVRGN